MRNPIARAIFLAALMLCLGALFLQTDLDVREAIKKTAASAKEVIVAQSQRIGNPEAGWGTRVDISLQQDEERRELAMAQATILNSSIPMTCDYDMEKLRRWRQQYNLQETFEYMKRYIQVFRENIPRKSITNVDENFLAQDFKLVNINEQYPAEMCPPPLIAPVSKSRFPSTVNASDFMFGVSTTYKRFTDPRTSPVNEWSYWLTDGYGHSNGGKLVLLLLDASDEDLENAYNKLANLGIDVDVYRSDPNQIMAVRYLALVPKLYNHPERSRKKWLVICDDDTFFPSFHALSDRLRQYDYTHPMYIGTLSEDVNNIQRHGSQAFGGAGVFLSVPMAALVTEKFESCKTDDKILEANSGWGPQGDILLRKCIYENSEIKLTLLPDLWQLDLMGDPSGFYESGIQPLSLHHYRGGIWHVAHPWHYTKVAYVCGEDCTFQRFRTPDNFIIANGFSVAQYPQGIDFDLGQFEGTFHAAPEDKGWNLDFAMGPQRPSLHRTGRKISWDLQEATRNDDGSVSQVYVRKGDDWRWVRPDGSPMREKDGIVELVWLPDER
ncbi:uncharacterized protein CTHT_0020280 [Thermochaetoides thermophila DSM 1495]|uniref:Fringe-like glycosyltransferase domain-containing protein n=1 Tax=Chaetomium thermophilum (strain DSM 1495 / CBS 144.50 / IMI 039719) TaxID=759272 RepID=G0S3A3_CHATD|nr:hypothetical protein CTHT_0020280 [Thermochaetoides thermophila DSM 1495]EGS22486.1 hypothetical protein CTHT_0020280 [Thermochaetoides thermophila DSM 1495]